MIERTRILREEYFGGILYDRQKINYFFLNREETKQLRDSKDVEFREVTYQNAPRGVISAPVRIYWEITRQCDKQCPQCFTSSGKPVEGELSLEDCLSVVEGLRKDNVLEIRITGGEPTTKEDWEEIIRYALNCGLVVTLNTHGCYDDPVREKIAKLKPDQVIVSLDGPQKIHDSIRGRGSFSLTMETIKYLSKKKVSVRVNTLLTKDVLPHLEVVVELVKDYVAELCFMQLKPIGRGGNLIDSMPTFQQMYEVDKRINLLRRNNQRLRISTSYEIISVNIVKPAPDLDLTTCAAGMRSCNIDSRGDIYACGFLEELGNEFKLGNIKASSFSVLKTWYESEELNKFRIKNLQKARKCRSCIYFRNPCFGSCIVMDSYASLKSKDRKDPYCYLKNIVL